MRKFNAGKILLAIVLCTIFLVSFLHLLRTINDPDFFWHLKAGELIWQQKAFPSNDPFIWTPPGFAGIKAQFAMTSYWLSEVIFYIVYLLGGLNGIVVLRFLLAGALIYVMFKLKQGDGLMYAGLLLMFLTMVLGLFPVERPHFFSFIFFALLVYLLERMKAGWNGAIINNSPRIGISPFVPVAALSVLMCAWANMHGGHVLGQGVLVLYIVVEGLKLAHPSLRPLAGYHYKYFLTACVLGLAASLVNPNTFHALEVLNQLEIGKSEFQFLYTTNVEYMPPLEFMQSIKGEGYRYILYFILMFAALAGVMANFRKADITKVALLAVTGYFSFRHSRYVPFAAIVAVAMSGEYLGGVSARNFARALVVAISLASTVVFSWNEPGNIRNLKEGEWINEVLYPVQATDFILANDLKGNMYNNYLHGGYLIWRLAPERTVFIYGRNANPQTKWDSLVINMAYGGPGRPKWKELIDHYNINYVILPFKDPFNPQDEIIPALLNDSEWVPVFSRTNSIIFVRNSAQNSGIIQKYAIPGK